MQDKTLSYFVKNKLGIQNQGYIVVNMELKKVLMEAQLYKLVGRHVICTEIKL